MTTEFPTPTDGWRSSWARRRAERAHARNLDTDSKRRAAQQSKEDRAAGRTDDPMSWPTRLLVAFVAAVVLAVAAVIALVVVGAQIGFYDTHLTTKNIPLDALGIGTPLNLPTFTPLATEGIVWATTLLAVVMVIRNKTATLWIRSMWTFASIAAFVNTSYSINDEHDLFGGTLRGALSLAGPYLVHLFILWCRHLRTGQSLAEARIDVAIRWNHVGRIALAILISLGQHFRHPVIAVRTTGYFLGVPQWSYRDSWLAASMKYRAGIQAVLEAAGTRPEQAADEQPVVEADGSDVAAEDPTTLTEPKSTGMPSGAPAWTEAEAEYLAAKLLDPSLTADAFSNQQEQAARPPVEQAAERRPKPARQAADDAPEGGRQPSGKAARTRPGTRLGNVLKAADVDVSELFPAIRQVAAEHGWDLNRDQLVEALRNKDHSVGGRRRAAAYAAYKNKLS